MISYWGKDNDEVFDFGISWDFKRYGNEKYQKLTAQLKAREETVFNHKRK